MLTILGRIAGDMQARPFRAAVSSVAMEAVTTTAMARTAPSHRSMAVG
jgi:hypothetical protein